MEIPEGCTHTLSAIMAAVRAIESALDAGLDINVTTESIPACHRKTAQDEYIRRRIIVDNPAPVVIQKRYRKEWDSTFKSSEGLHWLSLRSYLLDNLERSPYEVDSLDVASDEVLFNLGDPKETETKLPKVKGLVIGYVQSGKTANYTALAAKAFDAGFKVVIVLAGIHNALRRQTQIRLDTELGIRQPTADKPGVISLVDPAEAIIQMTSDELVAGDFHYMNIPNSILNNGKYLFVTKKNGAVLKRLNRWLGDNVAVPTLIIDDEADQASVNTKGNRYEIFEGDDAADPGLKDKSPAVINKLVRELVKKFRNVSYVGYTATPYANVFIANDAHDVEAGEDLYPRDFIMSLPKPSGYMGPEEFFGFDSVAQSDDTESPLSSSLIKIVPENNIAQLDGEPGADSELPVPESLAEAIRAFILSVSAKRTVEGDLSPASMLVHASHLSDRQLDLQRNIEKYMNILRRDWKWDRASCIDLWKSTWDNFCLDMPEGNYRKEFSDLELGITELLEKFTGIPVLLINYSSDDELDYETEPNLTAIIVGGNKLSRGLTLEGLLISYFVRKQNAPKADTLTQMGRFFGYKKHVVDLTRIYTTSSLRQDFQEVALVESALRREIYSYKATGKSPADFAPRVMRRAFLMPTSANKMKAVRKLGLTYSGDLVQTTSFPKVSELFMDKRSGNEVAKLTRNVDAVGQLLKELNSGGNVHEMKNSGEFVSRKTWVGVAPTTVLQFLDSYRVIDGATRFVPGYISRYIRDVMDKDESGEELSEWNVSIVGRAFDEELGYEDFGQGEKFSRISRALDQGSEVSIGSLVNPLDLNKGSGDELLGLSGDVLDRARALLEESPEMGAPNAIRTARSPKNASLVIYPLSPDSKGVTSGKRLDLTLGEGLFGTSPQHTVVGVSVVFPNSTVELDVFWAGKAKADKGVTDE
jgi:hypothetical protein